MDGFSFLFFFFFLFPLGVLQDNPPGDSLARLSLDHRYAARLDSTRKVITVMEFRQGEESVIVIPGERWTQDSRVTITG